MNYESMSDEELDAAIKKASDTLSARDYIITGPCYSSRDPDDPEVVLAWASDEKQRRQKQPSDEKQKQPELTWWQKVIAKL